MSKQCPFCKSWNTESRTASRIARVGVVLGGGLLGGLLGPFGAAGGVAGAAQATNNWDTHKCNSCGKTFKP